MKKKATDENELEAATAYDLASKLNLIPRFPRSDAATGAVADWLMKICKGAEVDGEYWTPKHQAWWLVGIAVIEFRNWETGGGLPAIQSIFNRKFSPPPALVEYEMLPAPEIGCTACNDQGTVEREDRVHWCSCEQARRLREEDPNLVDKMNRPRERKAEEEQRRRELKAKITRQFAERRRHAKGDQNGPGPVPPLRRSRLSRMLWNWAGRILRPSTSR